MFPVNCQKKDNLPLLFLEAMCDKKYVVDLEQSKKVIDTCEYIFKNMNTVCERMIVPRFKYPLEMSYEPSTNTVLIYVVRGGLFDFIIPLPVIKE